MKGRWWITLTGILFVGLMLLRVQWGIRTSSGALVLWWNAVILVGAVLLFLLVLVSLRLTRRGAFRLVASLRSQDPDAVVVQAICTDDMILGLGPLLVDQQPNDVVRVPSVVVCAFDREGMSIWNASHSPRLIAHVPSHRLQQASVETRSSPVGVRGVLVVEVHSDGKPPTVLPFVLIDSDAGLGLKPMKEEKLERMAVEIRKNLVRGGV